MKYSKWVGILSFVVIVIIAFQPWVYIASKNITVTGLDPGGTNFGKPALLNLIMGSIAVVLFLASSVIAKRANLFFCAFNVAWSVRNYIILSACRAGECPEKKLALYILVIASIVMAVAALLPDVALKEDRDN